MAQEEKESWQNSDTQLSNNPTEEEEKAETLPQANVVKLKEAHQAAKIQK